MTLHGVIAGELQITAFARGWSIPSLRSEVRRLHLEAGETRTLELELMPEQR